jgi:hypothetical protein
MSCCLRLDSIDDWYDWEGAQPLEPSSLIALAKLGGGSEPIMPGVRKRTTSFVGQSWGASQLSVLTQPVCMAVGVDKAANSADAEQWMLHHKTWDSSATLPDSLKKVMFMRGGERWRMVLRFTVTLPVGIDVIQLAFRDNAGTRGDYAGTYPVIEWTSFTPFGYTGLLSLYVDLVRFGRYNLVLWTKSKPTGTPAAPVYSMTEMEWIVVE